MKGLMQNCGGNIATSIIDNTVRVWRMIMMKSFLSQIKDCILKCVENTTLLSQYIVVQLRCMLTTVTKGA